MSALKPLVPPPRSADRRTTYDEVLSALATYLHDGGARVSPLGPEWSGDVDAHVHTEPPEDLLRRRGWLALDGLLARLRLPGRARWAVVVDGRVVGAADIHLSRPPAPLDAVVTRIRRSGRLGDRERAELEVLGADAGSVALGPARPSRSRRARSVAGRARSALRPRVVVAVTGVDGAGKSTLAHRLAADLDRAGVPHGLVWTRPGVLPRGVIWSARLTKRLLHQPPEAGVKVAARGHPERSVSRVGLLGRAWAAMIVVCFVGDVWRQHLRARGVVVHDRHARDAAVTMRVLYDTRPRGVAERLVYQLLPPATLELHLGVDPEVALARKPGDSIGDWAVRHQLTAYEDYPVSERQKSAGSALRLEAADPLDVSVLRALRALLAVVDASSVGPR